MNDIEKIVRNIADSLSVIPVETMTVKLRTVAAMLEYIPSYNQADAIRAAFGIKEEEDA